MELILVKYKNVKQDQLQVRSKEMISELVTLFDEDDEDEKFEPNPDLIQKSNELKELTGIEIELIPKSNTLVTSYNENRITNSEQIISIVRRFKYINNIIQVIHKVILTSKFDKNKRILEYVFIQINKLISKYEDTGVSKK